MTTGINCGTQSSPRLIARCLENNIITLFKNCFGNEELPFSVMTKSRFISMVWVLCCSKVCLDSPKPPDSQNHCWPHLSCPLRGTRRTLSWTTRPSAIVQVQWLDNGVGSWSPWVPLPTTQKWSVVPPGAWSGQSAALSTKLNAKVTIRDLESSSHCSNQWSELNFPRMQF